jgi:hypothetical protein
MSDAVKYASYAHRKELTFRQAEGIDPLPKMLVYGEIDQHLRLELWDFFYLYFDDKLYHPQVGYSRAFRDEALVPATLFCRDVLRMPIDEAKSLAKKPRDFLEVLKKTIFDGDYSDCLETVLFFLRYPRWQQVEKQRLADILDDPVSPYMVVDFPPLTIVPRGDENEAEAVKDNWAVVKASTFEGAKTHLRQSAEALNDGDSAGAIREAIHAVESASQVITGNKKATLGDALKVLEKDKGLNGILKEAFSKLYGYTNNEKGIRHALIDADNRNVGQDEALFMFSACTAFVSYLARKFPENV